MPDFDLAIVGGGINGAGIARDAAGRGLKVLLVEQNDLASGTSSASSKLIHGGLRYLEHGAFRLVREALSEREVLLRTAPHVVRPMRFVLPPSPGPRSPLKLRVGLFLYDHLGAHKLLPPTKTIDLTHHPAGAPLKRSYRYAFEYSDCAVDDARLVVLAARDAADRGASVRPRTRLTLAERGADEWKLVLNNRGRRQAATARVLVNAAGPWAQQVADIILRVPLPKPMRLVQGSHIVVRGRFAHDSGYFLQMDDKRIVFALPFGTDFTLIGTTDRPFVGDVNTPAPTPDEVAYLCRAVNVYFRDVVTTDEILWRYAGIRSLLDDGHGKPEDVTRDYALVLDRERKKAPLLTVYGGKITTFRRLAEEALARLSSVLPVKAPWTATAALPGGEFSFDKIDEVLAGLRERWPFVPETLARRLVHAYGLRTETILGNAASMDDLGPVFTGDLTGAEVRYLMREEWAQTAEDVLWRRTKLGLTTSEIQATTLAAFMAQTPPPPSA
ncbi:MAG: glycerol-3-phosphate dehydrogenase [Pseudolabrys sp.]|nr:glycerol-3-phosphate dehydrogenase [Pseudolabrys sp.]MCW5686341.1 glycerol-3-phosphate dehydrogenase [Pseudolabrys sp.]